MNCSDGRPKELAIRCDECNTARRLLGGKCWFLQINELDEDAKVLVCVEAGEPSIPCSIIVHLKLAEKRLVVNERTIAHYFHTQLSFL